MKSTYESMKNKKFSWFRALAGRYLKFGPVLAVLISLDILWPIIGQGPFYNQAAQELTKKCTGNWWTHLLMIGNINSFRESVSLDPS